MYFYLLMNEDFIIITGTDWGVIRKWPILNIALLCASLKL